MTKTDTTSLDMARTNQKHKVQTGNFLVRAFLYKFTGEYMRNFIFEFEQQTALNLKLKLTDLFLLDYLYKFSNSPQAKIKESQGKVYFWLTYNKVQEDLPILGIKKRQLSNIFDNLKQKGIIERLSGQKNHMYIFVNWKILTSTAKQDENLAKQDEKVEQLPQKSKVLENSFEKYSEMVKRNKQLDIKITNFGDYHNVDLNTFTYAFQKNLRPKVSRVAYSLFMHHYRAINLDAYNIKFSTNSAFSLPDSYIPIFTKTANDTLKQFMSSA